ncbi:MAG: hypothetical protein ABIJ34_06180 [archaeon]
MAKQTKSSKTVLKKKKWYTIVAPVFFSEKVLGESYLTDTETVAGRTITVNLMQLTGDIKAQNNQVKFEITGAKDSKIQTRIVRYEFMSAAIKRLIRRRMTRVDDSIIATTKDEVKIRIKPLVITRNKVSRSVEHRLRAMTKTEVINLVKSMSYEDLFSGIIKNRIQNELKNKLNFIYPLRSVVIRVLNEEKNKALPDTPLPVLRASKKGTLENEEKKEKKKVEKKVVVDDAPVEKQILDEKEEKSERKPRKKRED